MADPSVGAVRHEKSLDSEEATRPSRSVAILLGCVRLIALLPFSIRSALGGLLGYLVGLFPSRERRFSQLQLQAFLPEVSARAITPRVFSNVGRTLLESLRLQPIVQDHQAHIKCDAWSTVERWIADERPIVCLTGHTGNWDLLAAYVIARGVPLTTIGREARNPAAQAVLRSIREGYGIETIWRSDRNGLKRLVQCLRERRVIAALIDQDTRVESIPVPFFGASAKTPVSLITLGKKMNARFVTAFLFRTGWLQYSVFIEEISDADTELQILTTYHAQLERLIRRFPEQWVWFHKRWRSTADGTTLSSREYEATLRKRVGLVRG